MDATVHYLFGPLCGCAMAPQNIPRDMLVALLKTLGREQVVATLERPETHLHESSARALIEHERCPNAIYSSRRASIGLFARLDTQAA